MLNWGDLTEKANQIISNSVYSKPGRLPLFLSAQCFFTVLKNIKIYPEDVIDTLKEKRKKDVTSKISLNTAVPLGTGPDEVEQARLENEAYKLDFVNQMRDACIRDQTLDSNLRVA